jgi:hypothetical protein
MNYQLFFRSILVKGKSPNSSMWRNRALQKHHEGEISTMEVGEEELLFAELRQDNFVNPTARAAGQAANFSRQIHAGSPLIPD